MAAEVLSLEGRLTTLLNFSLIFAILSRFQSHKTLNIYKWSLLKKNCYIYNLELRKQNKKKSNRKNQKCQISSSPLESFCNCLEGIQRREDRRAPTSEAEREGGRWRKGDISWMMKIQMHVIMDLNSFSQPLKRYQGNSRNGNE